MHKNTITYDIQFEAKSLLTMATFSSHLLDAIGFREPIDKNSFAANFSGLTVYEIRGIALPEGVLCARQATVAGAAYKIALSNQVNAASQGLFGDDFVESEPDWLKETQAKGPFVLVAVGPTDFIDCEAGRMMQMPDGSITTYDSFPSVREILKSLEDRILPTVVATLTLALNEPERYVALRKLTRTSVGKTSDGVTVHDIRIETRGELTAIRTLDEPQANKALATMVEQAPKLNQRAAKYFALGIAEDDELKRFLYFFLSLEIETHAAFGRIDHTKTLRSQVLHKQASALWPHTTELLSRDIANWSNLLDRFVWCATCAWPSVADDDIRLFKQLKNARDAIAHGRASEPPVGFARKAELLAHKVLWGQLAS